MSQNPNFADTPNIGVAIVSGANAALDGVTGAAEVQPQRFFIAGSAGSRLEYVKAQAIGHSNYGMIRLFYENNILTLWDELPIGLQSGSSSGSVFSTVKTFPEGFVMPSGSAMRATVHNSESFVMYGMGGNF